MASRSRSRRRPSHDEDEEHENSERWLVTYADMLTLLMVLFIVMFAMSQVDEKKYQALKSGLADGFGQTTTLMSGSQSMLDNNGESLVPPMSEGTFRGPSTTQVVDRRSEQEKVAEAQVEVKRLEAIRKRLEAALRHHGLLHDVQTTIDNRGLVVSLVSRHVVFNANIAELTLRGRRVVDVLAPVLREIPDALRIDGHTNQVAVQPKYYDTDWDLSAARAVTVLRRLHEIDRVPEERMSMSAYGHERPLVDPHLPRSQAINKRVDIVVLSGLPAETRELLDDVARTPSAPEGGNS